MVARRKEEAKRSVVEDKIRPILHRSSYLVRDGSDITLPDIKNAGLELRQNSSESVQKPGKCSGTCSYVLLVSLCEKICIEHFGHGSRRNWL